MFLQERQDAILVELKEEGRVLVKDLAPRFGVTEDCIRKDLAALEGKGLLQRAYGGAVPARANPHRISLSQRQGEHQEEKREIAKKAYELIQEGETVFLDISSSSVETALLLAAGTKRVHVVTNMVEAMRALAVPCPVELTFLGGAFSPGRDGFVGSLTAENLSRFRCDRAFLGTVGIDLSQNSVFTYSIEDGFTKKAALLGAKQAYLMAEAEKYTLDGNFIYGSLSDFTAVLGGFSPASELAQKLKRLDTELL